jgi:hypothetical protein
MEKMPRLKSRTSWILCLIGIIALGIFSRMVHTGLGIFDKYLVYAILRLRWRSVALPSMAIMTVIELFQLTMVPARMLASEHVIVRTCARLVGTEFSFLDLLAYGFGIGCIYLLDFSLADTPT